MENIIYNSLIEGLVHAPYYAIGAIAIVGTVSVLLMYRGNDAVISSPNSVVIGLVLGVTCIFQVSLYKEFMLPTAKYILMLDYIFVAGLLGGFRNAVVAFIGVWIVRYLYGGGTNLLYATLDYSFPLMGSVIAHKYIVKIGISKIKAKHILILLLLRLFSVEISLVVLSIMSFPPDIAITLAIRRFIINFTASAVVLTSILSVFRIFIIKENQIYVDPISNLYNRRGLEKKLKSTKHSDRVVLLVTIMNLGTLNQRLGYHLVERICRNVGNKLISIYKPQKALDATIFSFSDRSFAVLMMNTTKKDLRNINEGQNLLDKLDYHLYQGDALRPTLFISIINVPANINVSNFSRTLAFFENQQKQPVQYYGQDIMDQMVWEERMHSLIKNWLHGTSEEIALWLQPKVNLQTGICYGSEALLRVQSSLGFVNPANVISMAEKYGLSVEFEWTIIKKVLNYYKHLPLCMREMTISINLTPKMFALENFADNYLSLMAKQEIPIDTIILEIIETSEFANTEISKENMQKLNNAGVKISLDDFGTGYSSLYLLSQYGFNEIKLDYTMISTIDNPRMKYAIQLSIDGALKYNATVVAEGIETEAHKQMLMDMGVVYGQGYLFGKAMPLNEFIEYSKANRNQE